MDIINFILTSVLCFIISSTVHELGHLLMGLAQGFRFYLLIVGPFGLKRDEDDKVVLYLEKNLSLWGGIGATVPQRDDSGNFRRFGRVLLAGPIASLLFGVFWLPFGIRTDNVFFWLLGAMPLAMGAACLIPSRNGAFYSDGGRWLRMRNESTRAQEVAIWSINQSAILHGGYAKVDLVQIGVLINDSDQRTAYLGHYYAYCHYRDISDTNRMEIECAELARLKTSVPKQMAVMFNTDKATI
ncbi:MAG: hypothetical protein ACM3ZQ_00565 [Bacillota bacterium]